MPQLVSQPRRRAQRHHVKDVPVHSPTESACKPNTAARGAASGPVPARPSSPPSLSHPPAPPNLSEHVGRPHPHGAGTMRAAGQLGMPSWWWTGLQGWEVLRMCAFVVWLWGWTERGGPCWAADSPQPGQGRLQAPPSGQGLNPPRLLCPEPSPLSQPPYRTRVHTSHSCWGLELRAGSDSFSTK